MEGISRHLKRLAEPAKRRVVGERLGIDPRGVLTPSRRAWDPDVGMESKSGRRRHVVERLEPIGREDAMVLRTELHLGAGQRPEPGINEAGQERRHGPIMGKIGPASRGATDGHQHRGEGLGYAGDAGGVRRDSASLCWRVLRKSAR